MTRRPNKWMKKVILLQVFLAENGPTRNVQHSCPISAVLNLAVASNATPPCPKTHHPSGDVWYFNLYLFCALYVIFITVCS